MQASTEPNESARTPAESRLGEDQAEPSSSPPADFKVQIPHLKEQSYSVDRATNSTSTGMSDEEPSGKSAGEMMRSCIANAKNAVTETDTVGEDCHDDTDTSIKEPGDENAAHQDEGEKASQLRKRNAIYSKRKYYKKKKETERLEVAKYELESANHKLRTDNARLELFLEGATKKIIVQESMERLLACSKQQQHPGFRTSHQGLLLNNMVGAGGLIPHGSSTSGLLGSSGLLPRNSMMDSRTSNTSVLPLPLPSLHMNQLNQQQHHRQVDPGSCGVGSTSILSDPQHQHELLERALRSQREHLQRSRPASESLEQRLRATEAALRSSRQQEQQLLGLLGSPQQQQLLGAVTDSSQLIASLLLEQREAEANRHLCMLQEQRQAQQLQHQDLLPFLLSRQQQQQPPCAPPSNSNDNALLRYLLSRQPHQQQGNSPVAPR